MIKKLFEIFEKNSILAYLVVIFIAFMIFYLSSIPGASFPPGLGIKTKVYHFGIFFLLSLFLSLGVVKGKKDSKYLVFLAIILALFYSITDEAHQIFVIGRHSDVNDILIDSMGILLAGIVYSIRLRYFNKKS